MLVANSTDYAVIVCYILLMIGVGLYVMRFNRTASEYFRGGSRIPWLVAGLSSFMSGFSAWTFTGGAGVAYGSGIVVIGLYLGNSLSFMLGYYIFASRWRRTRISTVMEYLSDRFGPTTHQTFSWATIVFQLFTSATTLYGLSLFVSTACQLSVTATILVTGGVILSYSVLGGLWAVVVADFLQASILAPILYCSRCGFAYACRRHLRTDPFPAPADEDDSGSRRVWMDLSCLLDGDGLVWLQHRGNGPAILQR